MNAYSKKYQTVLGSSIDRHAPSAHRNPSGVDAFIEGHAPLNRFAEFAGSFALGTAWEVLAPRHTTDRPLRRRPRPYNAAVQHSPVPRQRTASRAGRDLPLGYFCTVTPP